MARFAAFFLAAAVLAGSAASCGDDDSAGTAGDSPARSAATATAATGNAAPKSVLGKKINETKVPESLADGTRIGKADAKVVIEAYEDFGCPHCLDFTALVEPTILDYVAKGNVALVYRFFPLRQATAGAAIAAWCAADQDRFWEYHRSLFIAQAEANEKSGPSLAEAFAIEGLQQFAVDLGLDTAAFDACLASDAAVAGVQADLRKVNELSLPGTPSFVINGKVTASPESAGDWKKLLDGLLK